MEFNKSKASLMHLDINSCFATIEQQANPHLRGKPLAVAAYASPGACILAASIEAKQYGVKTGMRVFEGKSLCPGIEVILPDPDKYRFVHKRLRKLLCSYSCEVVPKSIDEFVLDMGQAVDFCDWQKTAKQIKTRIKAEIGEWIRVSIGFGPSRFLAKTAAGLQKPDGCSLVDKNNFYSIYSDLELTDLCGINRAYKRRLNSVGIYTVLQFYEASPARLRAAFHSVAADYWYLRLRGWEVDGAIFARKSFGNSKALAKNYTSANELSPILSALVAKATSRMRKAGYSAKGVSVGLSFKGGGWWQRGRKFTEALSAAFELYPKAMEVLKEAPFFGPVHTLSVSCFSLVKTDGLQLSLYEDRGRSFSLSRAVDTVNRRFGQFTVGSARAVLASSELVDRISFGQSGMEL